MVTGESRYEKVVSAVELAPNDHLLKTSRPMRSTSIYRARRSDPAHPRIAALTSYYQNMLSKYGIQPGRS
ncbi:MAG: hypothetical protein FJY34_07855 [Betaproteobacteria bacterium]|nr:hypothetical protein [Betaproteobacteria bacterium]